MVISLLTFRHYPIRTFQYYLAEFLNFANKVLWKRMSIFAPQFNNNGKFQKTF